MTGLNRTQLCLGSAKAAADNTKTNTTSSTTAGSRHRTRQPQGSPLGFPLRPRDKERAGRSCRRSSSQTWKGWMSLLPYFCSQTATARSCLTEGERKRSPRESGRTRRAPAQASTSNLCNSTALCITTQSQDTEASTYKYVESLEHWPSYWCINC